MTPDRSLEADEAKALGCNSGSCLIEKPTGQHNNGPCRCFRDGPDLLIQRLVAAARALRAENAALRRGVEEVRSGIQLGCAIKPDRETLEYAYEKLNKLLEAL